MGPGEFLPALFNLVSSPINTLALSSLFAYEKPNTGYDFSSDKGNFPNDVLAYFESNAIANALRPSKNNNEEVF